MGATWNAVRIAAGKHSGASGSTRTTRAVNLGLGNGRARPIVNVSVSSSPATARCLISTVSLRSVFGTRNGNGGNNPPVGECETCIDRLTKQPKKGWSGTPDVLIGKTDHLPWYERLLIVVVWDLLNMPRSERVLAALAWACVWRSFSLYIITDDARFSGFPRPCAEARVGWWPSGGHPADSSLHSPSSARARSDRRTESEFSPPTPERAAADALTRWAGKSTPL